MEKGAYFFSLQHVMKLVAYPVDLLISKRGVRYALTFRGKYIHRLGPLLRFGS